MFKRILVAVDGSEIAAQALQEAIKLAKEMQSQLRIVHAVDILPVTLDTEFPNPPEFTQALIQNGQAVLRKAAAEAAKAGVAAESHLIESESMGHRIPEMITADADAWHADLIVISSHGRKGLSRLLMGSVAEGIVRVASTPVLLIRGK